MNLQFTIHPQIVNLNRFSIQRIVNRDVPSSFLRLSFSGSRTTTIKLVTPTVQNKFLEDTRSPGLHQSSPTRPRGRFPLAAAYIHAQADEKRGQAQSPSRQKRFRCRNRAESTRIKLPDD